MIKSWYVWVMWENFSFTKLEGSLKEIKKELEIAVDDSNFALWGRLRRENWTPDKHELFRGERSMEKFTAKNILAGREALRESLKLEVRKLNKQLRTLNATKI